MYYTNYYFVKEILSSIDNKYLEGIDLNNEKILLYANTYTIPVLFRLTKIKKFSYDLYTKLTTFRQDMLILNMVKETKKNKFYTNNILILYSVASSLILYEELKKTNISIKEALEYDYQFAYNNQVMVSGNSLYKKNKNCFLYSFTELDFISNALSNTYYIPNMDTYMRVSLNQFKKCLKKNIFNLLVFKIKDILFYHKKDTKYQYYVYKRKYSNKLENIYYNNIEMSFDDFIKQTKTKALAFIEAINQALYFDKQAPIVDFSKEYSWTSIIEHYNFINKVKEDEVKRNKLWDRIRKEKRKLKKKIKNKTDGI